MTTTKTRKVAAPTTKGARHGRQQRNRPARRRAQRVPDRTHRVRHSDGVVASRGAAAPGGDQRVDATRPIGGARSTAREALAFRAGVAAGILRARAFESAHCTQRLPLDQTADLDVDQRIALGDAEALHDSLTAAIEELDEIRVAAAALLMEDDHAAGRMAAILEHKRRTAKNWTYRDAGVMDHAGKEPRRSRGRGGKTPARQGRRRGQETNQC
jgi:hypothetical protein